MPARSRKVRRLSRRWTGGALLILISVSLTLTEALRVARHRAAPLSVTPAVEEFAVDDPRFERLLGLATGMHVDAGNRVDVLLNGDGTWPPLLRDLSSARHSIAVQMYYAKPGRVSDTLAAILCDRARAGVPVRFLLDAFGATSMPKSWVRRMQACGVQVALLRTLQWYTIHSATDRSHVRAVVVDGRIGYTGGFGLADYWMGDGHHADQWRESNVRFEGPAVGGLQAAFAAAWAESTGELMAGAFSFPNDVAMGVPSDSLCVRAGLLFTEPTVGNTAAERFLALVIRSARKRLYITNSYFVPNQSFRQLLESAGDRGVDVRVLTAGANTDVRTPWLAGRYRYDELVAHGVRIYEYQPSMMHAKTIVVDGVWSTIGSMNFDNHSLGSNDESNLVVIGGSVGATMDSAFVDDLRYAKEMTPSELANRSVLERLLERGAVMLARLL